MDNQKQPQNSETDDLYSIANMAVGLSLLIAGLLHTDRLEELSYIPIVLIFDGPSLIAAAGAGSQGGWRGFTERLKNASFFSPSWKQPKVAPGIHCTLS
jgi:hypothetical protein